MSFNTATGVFTGPSAWDFQATQVAAGFEHTCAVATTGGVKCWGRNQNSQLGDGTSTQRTTPVDVLVPPGGSPLTGVAQLSAGRDHTCAVTTSGGAQCWGSNNNGRLGDGTTTQSRLPVNVRVSIGGSPLTGVASISGGGSHTCAVTTTGGAKCWGSNNNGRLGDGTTTQSRIPVNVSGVGNSGWPASITVTVTATDSRTANTNVTLTNI